MYNLAQMLRPMTPHSRNNILEEYPRPSLFLALFTLPGCFLGSCFFSFFLFLRCLFLRFPSVAEVAPLLSATSRSTMSASMKWLPPRPKAPPLSRLSLLSTPQFWLYWVVLFVSLTPGWGFTSLLSPFLQAAYSVTPGEAAAAVPLVVDFF